MEYRRVKRKLGKEMTMRDADEECIIEKTRSQTQFTHTHAHMETLPQTHTHANVCTHAHRNI